VTAHTLRLRGVCSCPVVKGGSAGRPYVALEHVEGGTGRLVPGTELEGREADDAALFEPGDVLFGKLRPYLHKVLAPDFAGCCSTELLVLRPRPGVALSRFLFYAALSRRFAEWADATSYGTKMPRTSWEQMRDLTLKVPGAQAQGAVVNFLDRETARIDDVVAKKQRLIELLEEKRTALITQAVTKGLDPTVPMRDSGVEWFGEIPADWEVAPLKRRVGFREGPGIMAASFREEGTPLLRIGNLVGDTIDLAGCNFLDPVEVMRHWQHLRVRRGELLISASASTGRAVVVSEVADGAIPYTGLIRLWPLGRMLDVTYLRFFLSSGAFQCQVDRLKTGVGITHWGPTHLSTTTLTLPPIDVQKAIAARLGRSLAAIDSATTTLRHQLDLLAEYRQALITAAVTGQIDVLKGAPDPEEAVA